MFIYYMDAFLCILIECDNTKSLGKSCERDLFNIYTQLIMNKTEPNNIYILTNNTPFFIQKNISTNLYNNNVSNLDNILKNNKNFSSFYFHISGHGYLGNDIRHIEITNRCEQIVLSSGILTDYQFNDLLIKYIDRKSIIRISVDTCHSGTFSNFCYKLTDEYTHKQVTKKEPYFQDAYSISACNDNELDSCDIGKVGFGGSLTVHLLDDNNFNEFIFGDKIKVKNNLCKILKLLRQEPILLVDMI